MIRFSFRQAVFIPAACLTALSFGQQTSVLLDGEKVVFEGMQPQVISGTFYVPLRGVFEKMGAEVVWDQPQHRLTINEGSHVIEMRVLGKSAMVDNRAVNMSARALLIHGNVLIPLRFISTALGCKTEWDQVHHSVSITSDDGRFISRDRQPALKKHGGG